MPAPKQAGPPYSKSFGPIANLVRTVRELAVKQEWHKVDGCWFRRIDITDGFKGELELDAWWWEVAEADAQLRDALAEIAKVDPNFRETCDRGRLPLP